MPASVILHSLIRASTVIKPSTTEMSSSVTVTSSSTICTSSPPTVTSVSATATLSSPAGLPTSSFIVSATELAPAQPQRSSSAPAPPPLLEEPVRLWVGNIQPRVAEYQLLRLAQPAGTITKFDFMLHGAGPQAGRPRGYAFLSYNSHRQAEVARRRLSGAPLGGARLVCRWAHEQTLPGDVKIKEEPAAAAPAPATATTRPKPGTQSQIRAIETKLQHMTGGGGGEQRFSVTADSERTDVRRLPRVRGPLSWVNAPSKQAAQQPKPYSRRRW